MTKSKCQMPKQHLHVMGIAGSGAGVFAKLAEAYGYKISGCDLSLRGHSPTHLEGVDLLVTSPAILSYDPDNSELKEARRRGIQTFTWQEFLGEHLIKDQEVIGVCGTHGKSTISAMIAYLLSEAGFDPSFLLGAKIKGGESFGVGEGDYFIVEADEYNDNFLHYPVTTSVCVALEFDHPEWFSSFDEYLDAFRKFVCMGKRLICYEKDQGIKQLLKRIKNWKGEVIKFENYYQDQLQLPGDHNRINAQAAYLAAKSLGVPEETVRQLLASFPDVERRLELKKIVRGTKIYSDYGHHPTQLRATFSTLRQLYPKEWVSVIFQPHMFSRTKAFFEEFVEVFREGIVDQVAVVDIFPSREKDPGDISSRDVVEAVGTPSVWYLPRDEILQRLKTLPAGVVIFIGAGDINKLIERYAE